MDGNGRWARARGLPRIEGHRRGADSVRRALEACERWNVSYLTLYCFSNENWKRPAEELDFLMGLLTQYLIRERETLIAKGIRLLVVGRRAGLPQEVLDEIDRSVELTKDNQRLTLTLAINYGARQEIVDAVKQICVEVQSNRLRISDIDEFTIAKHLYTAQTPDPDLVIRTSGELRISNFLLWQISYSELWVTTKPWPEFGDEEFAQALRDYSQRQRRFGDIDVRKA